MTITNTNIPGLKILTPIIHGDTRGYFMENFREEVFRGEIAALSFIQENESKSVYGVLRGLHFQNPPYAQSKLVRVVTGKVLDVAVDIRQGSPTFGQHFTIELSEENKKQLFIPRGFAHGFVVLSDVAIFQYKVDGYYAPEHDAGFRYDDPSIGIDWQIPHEHIKLSKKDETAPAFENIVNPFYFGENS